MGMGWSARWGLWSFMKSGHYSLVVLFVIPSLIRVGVWVGIVCLTPPIMDSSHYDHSWPTTVTWVRWRLMWTTDEWSYQRILAGKLIKEYAVKAWWYVDNKLEQVSYKRTPTWSGILGMESFTISSSKSILLQVSICRVKKTLFQKVNSATRVNCVHLCHDFIK